MKKCGFLLSVALACGMGAAAETRAVGDLPAGPEAWLELMGGNVRLDGLTKDLEAIRAAGISGVHLFHIFRSGGEIHPGSGEPMACTGPKWEAMVRHVSDECRRLGLKLVLQNCPGWSQSGGPWITPDRAMRDLACARRDLEGGESLTVLPPVPEKYADRDSDWRDVCVLAFPTPLGDETGELKPVGKTQSGDEIVYRFAAPVTVRTMSLPCLHHWNTAYGYHVPWRRVTLEAKTPGGWKTVLDSPIPTTNWRDYVHDISFACDEATSDTWRYRIAHDFPFKRTFEPTFSAAARLTDWQAKAGWTLRSLLFEAPAKQLRTAWIDPAAVIDLTGRASWTAPAGHWTVLRFGHVNAKYVNAPAPKEATGWECDKLDPAGIETHFAGYVGKLADGVLKDRLHGMLVDSWECWCQTWTAKMEDYYRAANGEELRANLPALFGWIVGSPERTEAFLTRWRRTVGDLVTKNYYGRMAELAHAKNLACYYETAFGDIIYGDLLEYWKHADAPMCEFWCPHTTIDEGGCPCYDYKPIRPCASAAHVYGKRRVSAEAFTGSGIRWNEDFAKLQDHANRHLARGVTHLVFQSYTHQPNPDATPPGDCMGGYNGTPFSRLQTWWKDMPEFIGFLTRCEKLLEEGLPSQDVLWYLGDAVDHKPPECFPFPEGFRADYLNHDVLTNRLTVKDGAFTIPEGTAWKILWVPETRFLLPATKASLDRLAAAGGRVVYGDKAALVRALAGLERDVATVPALGDEPSEDFMWIHRRLPRGERYFVASGTNGYRGTVTFRAKGPATVYDPVTCTRRVWTNGGVLELPPSRSVFVDFCPSAQPVTTRPKTDPATETVRVLKDFTLRFAPGWGAPETVKLETPVSWTEIPGFSREARAYAGTVAYETTFDLETGADGRLPVATLDLGRVSSHARVFVNGRCAGFLWCAPYRLDLTPYVVRGTNRLRLEVTNTWRNRLIYDLGQPEAKRKTWIVYQPGYNPTANDPLEPAGILGSVTLTTAQRTNDPYDYKDLAVRDIAPVSVHTNAANHAVVDFGRDAIGWLEVGGAAGPFEIVIGEMTNAEGRVTNPHPGSTIRVQTLKGEKPQGVFRPEMTPDRWNLVGYNNKVSPAILLPENLRLVFPFRYAEIVRLPSAPTPDIFRRKAVNYPIDLSRSAFACSDGALARVYDFCKYSILATSFTGIYVDGDRERTPYEADAYINQLAHYAIDDDCSLARRSFEWLMDHPTWPTEWKQHMIKMAWADWMWTGDTRAIAKFYEQLRDVKLMRRYARASDGLLETGGEMKKGARPGAADIVDWPQRERDGFEFRPVNAVVNAFFVRNLEEMRDLAAALGKTEESAAFAADASRLRTAYQRAFFDARRGLYVDGEGAAHASVQANAAALAFGLVPPDRIRGVADWLVGRGMACSTYFSQYLLEALFAAGRDEAAIALMTARGDRGWLGMMDFGSTITMESWNMKVKPNQDLNHAWSATPLSMISRFVLGVTPLEPGFAKVSVRPQIGRLASVSGTVPTAKGPVKVDVRNGILRIETPVPARVVWKGRTYDMPAGVRAFDPKETDGWENANPDRREFLPARIVWTAPADGYKIEREDGAEGEVSVSNGVITVRKTNDRGRIVVSAPPFWAEKGRMLRFFADVEALTDRPQEALGYVCVWSDVRKISPADPLSPWGGFDCGGETMRRLVNSAPQTPYRKFMHHTPVSEKVTAALVVAGAASVSVWKNLSADDQEAAQAKWADHFKRLHAPDRRGDLQDEAAFDRSVAADIDHTACIETRDGYSRFVVDGEVRAPIVYKSCEWNFDGRVTYAGKPLQEAGVRIAVVNLRLGDLKLPSFSGPWTEKGFDVQTAVRTVKDEMRVADKSLFVLALGTSAYPEFTEKEHPDEVWIKKDGSVAYGNSGSVIPDRYNDGGKPDPGDRRWPWVSPASPAWRAAVKRVTGELFAELRRTGLMKRIIGVHYFGYHDGQFAMPILDYSPCAKAEYASYLNENGLKETDPAGSFEYFSKQLGFRALEDFSREAKRLAGKPIVACKWEMSSFNISFDVTSFQRSDAVDIIVPQANYHKRFPALPQGLNMATASLHRHRKMLWLEFDFRTWAAFDQWAASLPYTKGLSTAEDLVMWRTMIRKNAGMMNACRMGFWLYDMGGGWYYPPEIVEDFKGVWDVRQKFDQMKPDPWHPEVAFVVDELAMANYNTPHGPKVKDPVTLATLQWPRNAASGVPYETYLAEDFYAEPDLAKRYRAVFLAGFVSPSARQRELMAKIAAAGAKTRVVQPGGLTASAFHAFARESGAFVAAEPGVLEVDMNGDFLSVHCLVPGTHVIRLPFRAEVTNLKTGACVTADRLTLPLTAGETRWFRLRRTHS